MREYPVKGEIVTYLSKENMVSRLISFGHPKWKAKLIGGYCFPHNKTIFIRLDRIKDIRLLNHERGHLMGYSHTWRPTLMASSWVYRWINRYYPPHGRKGE